MRRIGSFAASPLIAVPWALWHVPLFFANGTLGAMGLGGMMGWAISLLAGSFLMSWLYLVTGRSLLAVAIFHGLLDLAMVNPAVGALGMNVQGALVTIAGIVAGYHLRREARDRP